MKRVSFLTSTIVLCALAICSPAAAATVTAQLDMDLSKGDLSLSQIVFDTPTSLAPSTAYDFELTVNFWSDNQYEWLYSTSLTLPAGYTVNSAQDPSYVNEQGWWNNTITGTKIDWVFDHYEHPGAGDVHRGYSVTYSFNATTDGSATNDFDCVLTGDEEGVLSRAVYIGAPVVDSIAPATYSVVELDQQIVVTFSTAMDTGTVAYTCTPDPGNWTEVWSESDTVLTLTHDDFELARNYLFRVTAGDSTTGLPISPMQVTYYTHGDAVNSPFTKTPPTFDGLLLADEWADAEVIDISATGSGNIFLYIMNDLEYIYIGLDIPGDTQLDYNQFTGATDQYGIYFDENNDDAFPATEADPVKEGLAWLIYLPDDPPYVQSFRQYFGDYAAGTLDYVPSFESSLGLQAMLGTTMGHVQIEAAYNAEEGFINPELPGTFGMRMFYFEAGSETYMGTWPRYSNGYLPATYMDINLAEAEAPEVLSIEPAFGYPNLTTEVTVTAEGISNDATLHIGETECINVQVLSSSLLTALVPSGVPIGLHDVIITNRDQQQGVLADGFESKDPNADDDDDAGDDDAAGDDDDDDDQCCK
ncbi:MAG: IPT/TIG domain-containing protein [Candidatus Alcyoniella australis]|nr:IPT/TIG domain-containing protein [Candidatus Alcyoniella australis]